VSKTDDPELIVLDTIPIDRPKAESCAFRLHKRVGFRKPPDFIWCESPAECYQAYRGYLRTTAFASAPTTQKLLAWFFTKQKPPRSVRWKRHDWLSAPVYVLERLIRQELQQHSMYNHQLFLVGNHDAAWYHTYKDSSAGFPMDYWAFVKAASWCIPLPNVWFMSERPTIIRVEDQRIHSYTGPAVLYRDGFAVYAFRSIRVPPAYTDPALAPHMVLHERNAELRRELVKKIGVKRLVEGLVAEPIDKWNDYELLKINVPGMRTQAVYLKMINPSTGDTHIEGVNPSVKTCKEALQWRLGGIEWDPDILT